MRYTLVPIFYAFLFYKFTMNNCVVLSNPFGLPKEQYLKKKENCIINIPTTCLM